MGRAKGRRLDSERRVMPKARNTDETPDGDVQVSADETKDLGFYNPHDGLKGRDGGPYLDFVEREQQEKVRANKENREPVTGGETPAVAGTPLVPANQVVDNSVMSNPSRFAAPGLEVALSDDTFTDTDFLADPVSVLPVSVGNEPPEGKLDPTVDGSPSASPGAEVMRGDAPDVTEASNPGSVGTETGNTAEKS